MHELTGFQRDLLIVVAGLDDPDGLAVKSKVEDYYEQQLHQGRLYTNLDVLADRGFVEKSVKDSRTNAYGLTPDGGSTVSTHRRWATEQLEHLQEDPEFSAEVVR